MAPKQKGRRHKSRRKTSGKKQQPAQSSVKTTDAVNSSSRAGPDLSFVGQTFAVTKYILGLIGLMAVLMTVTCSLAASGVAVPGLAAIPDSIQLTVLDSMASGLFSFCLTAVLGVHLLYLIIKEQHMILGLAGQAFKACRKISKVVLNLLGVTVLQGAITTVGVSTLIASDASLPWCTLGQLLDLFDSWMPDVRLGHIVVCCLVVDATASMFGKVLSMLWLKYVANGSRSLPAETISLMSAYNKPQTHHAISLGFQSTPRSPSHSPSKGIAQVSHLEKLKSPSAPSVKAVDLASSPRRSGSSDDIGAVSIMGSPAVHYKALSSKKQAVTTRTVPSNNNRQGTDGHSVNPHSLPDDTEANGSASNPQNSDSSIKTANNGFQSATTLTQSSNKSSESAVVQQVSKTSDSISQPSKTGSSSLNSDSTITQGHNDVQPAATSAGITQTDTTGTSNKQKKRRSRKQRSTAAPAQAPNNASNRTTNQTEPTQKQDTINSGYQCMVMGLLSGAVTAPGVASKVAGRMATAFKYVPKWMTEFEANNKENCSSAVGLVEFQNLLNSPMTPELLRSACSPSMQLDSMIMFLKTILAANLHRAQRAHTLALTGSYREDRQLAEDTLCMVPPAGMPKVLYQPPVWQLVELCKTLDVGFACKAAKTQKILGHRTSWDESFVISMKSDGNDYVVQQ